MMQNEKGFIWWWEKIIAPMGSMIATIIAGTATQLPKHVYFILVVIVAMLALTFIVPLVWRWCKKLWRTWRLQSFPAGLKKEVATAYEELRSCVCSSYTLSPIYFLQGQSGLVKNYQFDTETSSSLAAWLQCLGERINNKVGLQELKELQVIANQVHRLVEHAVRNFNEILKSDNATDRLPQIKRDWQKCREQFNFMMRQLQCLQAPIALSCLPVFHFSPLVDLEI